MKKGFTLIELLVAMAVLIILASIGLVMYNSMMSRNKAKNAKVVQDFEILRKAMIASFAVDGEFPGRDYVSTGEGETYNDCSTPPCPRSKSNWAGVMQEVSANSIIPPKDAVYCLYVNGNRFDRFLFIFYPFKDMTLPPTHNLFSEPIGKKLDPASGEACGEYYMFVGGINDHGEGVAYDDNDFNNGHCPDPCAVACEGTPIATEPANELVTNYCVYEEAPEVF